MVNPMQLVAMLQQSNNPAALINMMCGSNPALQRAMQMAQGKSPQELRGVVENLARQRGMDDAQLAQFLSQFGL